MAEPASWRILAVLLVCASLVCDTAAADLCRDHHHDHRDDDEGYDTGGHPVPGKLNVHLVPHTHDDVGWLKTVDQYFVGSNNSIQVAAVQYIIDSVVDALEKDHNRKFVYVEQAFFQRWWREQSRSKQRRVKRLVKFGQLEFINGGWCMHDEATTHYIDMIDQTTLGHRFLKEQFNKVPRIGWQLDPFGHSATQGYLLGAEVGFDAVFFARADYQDKEKRLRDRSMEFIWRGSKSLGASAQVFGAYLYNHYSAPEEFNFEIEGTSPVIQDDPQLYDYNVQNRVEAFVQYANEQSQAFRTNHIMWTMGGDFTYEYAQTWYKQMDKLIHYVNKDGRVNALYSTPSIYVDSKHAANETWPVKTGDFFPYANAANCFWTGYFTSRPSFKRLVRQASGLLQAARQLEVLVGRRKPGPNTDSLEEALAIVQHHDGVSGTEKQHVANDYVKRLYIGTSEAAEVVNGAFAHVTKEQSGISKFARVTKSRLLKDSPKNIERPADGDKETMKFHQCFLLNISYCPTTEFDLSSGKALVVMAYNPLGWARQEIVRIPVRNTSLEVTDSNGNPIPAQLVPMTEIAKTLRDQYVKAYLGISVESEDLSLLVFHASVPPLGFSSFHIKRAMNDSSDAAERSSVKEYQETGHLELRLKHAPMEFSQAAGRMLKTETGIAQSYCWYNASDGNTDVSREVAGGAYIFRPNSSTCFPIGDANVPLTLVDGPLVEEVHQQFSPWVSQVVRFNKDAEHAEVEFLVGPIPVEDGLGKDVVTKLTTNLQSNGEFYTDSNGRDFLKRVRDQRPDWELEVTEPIAGNYYPLNLGVYLSDNGTDFSILIDRAVGGSSIKDGELELMLHRRILRDDNKGVHEILNETVCIGGEEMCEGLKVQGTYYLHIGPKANATRWRRSYGQRILMPLQLSFAVVEDSESSAKSTSKLSVLAEEYELPPNIALITLQELERTSVLLRLAHLYEIDEDEDLSTLSTVDLKRFFGGKEIDEINEMTLSGNEYKPQWKPLQWNVEDSSGDVATQPLRGRPFKFDRRRRDKEILVELGPQEIRTFKVSFVPKVGP